jgi:SAM-dependent methyltransferase
MGHQVHIGGFASSMALADKAGIREGWRGVDLCCCSGAGMRFLVRFRGVASMHGVDFTRRSVERCRQRSAAEGLADRVEVIEADACRSGLPAASADFVWGEDAWCYVPHKARLLSEAVRLAKPGGTVAFTDWVEGPAGLSADEAGRFLRFMKFPDVYSLDDYTREVRRLGCTVVCAEDTGLFAPHVDLYLNMLNMQLTYDALRCIGFDLAMLQSLGAEMTFLQGLARAGKVAQARVVARTPA